MDYLSVCSGIEAASVAWHDFAQPVAFAEIAAFPSAVLAHRFPRVPNVGDIRGVAGLITAGRMVPPSVLVGGTPCQSFSFAGGRASLDDPRGQLMLSFIKVANAIDTARLVRGKRPCTVLWENVAGCLSTRDNAFGHFIAGLAGEEMPLEPPRGKWAHAGYVLGPQRAVTWRVFDAKYFGVAQRRPRVFVIASAYNGANPSEILFEQKSMRWDTAAGRNPQAAAITGLACGAGGVRGGVDENGLQTIVGTLCADTHPGAYSGQDAYTGRLIPVFSAPGKPCAVRRLLPVECERLQGFPDDWTYVPWRGGMASDSVRYMAIGNSMAVPVIRWIGLRIALAQSSISQRRYDELITN